MKLETDVLRTVDSFLPTTGAGTCRGSLSGPLSLTWSEDAPAANDSKPLSKLNALLPAFCPCLPLTLA